MGGHLFYFLNLAILLVVLFFLIRYLWDMFSENNYQPSEWQLRKKAGLIPSELVKAERNYPDKVRFFNWWFQVERLKKEGVRGEFAELGVYKGESARILHLLDPKRRFHLFDTFEGFKGKDLERETGEAATYTTRHFADTNIEKVMRRIAGNENIVVHPGYFPETAKGLEETAFALVNIDADLFNPTLAGLEFFYPRLSPGGVLVVHDYNPKWEGVVRAVDTFMQDKPESPVVLPDMEGSVMIIRSRK